MIFCTKCGESAHDGANVCWKCGTALHANNQAGDARTVTSSAVPELAGGISECIDVQEPVVTWPNGYEILDLREKIYEKTEPLQATADYFPYYESPFVFSRSLPVESSPLEVLRLAVFVIVRFEGPLHELDVVRRIARMWLRDRAGPKCKDATFIGLASARKMGWLLNDGPFWQRRDVRCDRLRYRFDDSTRNIDRISPEEISAGARHILRTARSGDATQLALEVARHAGFNRPKAKVVTRIRDILASENRLSDGV